VWPSNASADSFESAGRIAQYNIRFVARLFYALLMATCAYLLITTPDCRDNAFLALSAYFLFTALFHLIYGTWQVYVFSAHYTFPWIALLALPMRSVADLSANGQRIAYATLALFLIFMLVNNGLFALELVKAFP
jgi:fatty acid desaturase